MVGITVAVPKEIEREMKSFPEVNWSAVAREAIRNKIIILQKFKNFSHESELTEKDALELGKKVNKSLATCYGQ